jgi:hypothetical protein
LDFRKFVAADVAARASKGNRAHPFSNRSPVLTGSRRPGGGSLQLKPSFKESGENWISAPKQALSQQKSRTK